MRAAREVFSERGYDAATFQAIAIRADLTRPAINHYFSNKRALYREVAMETNELVVAASIRRAQRETTLIGRVSAFIDAATQADIENRTAAAFLITVALESQRHPELSHEEADSIRTTREFLSGAIDDAIKRGELAPDTDALGARRGADRGLAGSRFLPRVRRQSTRNRHGHPSGARVARRQPDPAPGKSVVM